MTTLRTLENKMSVADSIKEQAVTIMTQIKEAVTTAATWSWDQLSDVAYQYVMFQRAYLTIVMIVGVVLIAQVIPLTKRALEWQPLNEGPVALLPTFGGGMGIIMVWWNFYHFMMVWFAPKVFLITELVKVVR